MILTDALTGYGIMPLEEPPPMKLDANNSSE